MQGEAKHELTNLRELGLVEAVGNGWRLTPAGARLMADIERVDVCHCGAPADSTDGRGEQVCARHYA